jgi:hypothetical protein
MINARYTVVLKTLMDDENVKPLLEKALSTYPIYKAENEATYTLIPNRSELNQKLLNAYKYREIGFETIGRFLDELEISMNEIMPYYNQLYKSLDIMNGITDPFGNVDITETFEEEREGTTTGSSTGSSRGTSESTSTAESNGTTTSTAESTNNSKNIKSDTPQGLLDIGTKDINSVNYGNEAVWNEDINNSSGSNTDHTTSSTTGGDTTSTESEANSTDERKETVSHTFKKIGNQGVNTYAHDMKELREIFLNIEQQIINDKRITELFMNIY